MQYEFLNPDRATSSHTEGLEAAVINFIDILLVVLVFFMVRENLSEKAPPLAVLASHLTETQGQSLDAIQDPSAVVSFTGGKHCRVYWNKESIELQNIPSRVEALTRTDRNAVIFLAGDKDAEYGLSLKIRTILSHYAVKVRELSQQTKE